MSKRINTVYITGRNKDAPILFVDKKIRSFDIHVQMIGLEVGLEHKINFNISKKDGTSVYKFTKSVGLLEPKTQDTLAGEFVFYVIFDESDDIDTNELVFGIQLDGEVETKTSIIYMEQNHG